MKLYLFDFNGTLTRLTEPLAWLARLREQNPGCKVVVWTGASGGLLQAKMPGLAEAVDAVWYKLSRVQENIVAAGWEPTQIIVVDDDHWGRESAEIIFHNHPHVEVLDETALEGLVRR